MLMTRTAARKGKVLADLMGVGDPGRPPVLPPYLERTDPSPTSPFPDPVPMSPGGAILQSITASGNLDPSTNGGMIRYRTPDGTLHGEKLPMNAAGQSIVATPEQEAESARIAAQVGGRPDYAAILRGALGERPKMNTVQTIASIVGPALLAASGNEGLAMQMASQVGARGREWDERARQADLTAAKWSREDEIAARERNAPKYLSGASDQLRLDPATGKVERIYDAPEDFETYAGAQGHQPGTQAYFDAAQDYVLRGNGPTAFQFDRDLEAIREAKAKSIEAARQVNRERLRGLPTYRDTHAPPARPRSNGGAGIVSVKSPQEAMKLAPGTKFRGPDGVTRVRP